MAYEYLKADTDISRRLANLRAANGIDPRGTASPARATAPQAAKPVASTPAWMEVDRALKAAVASVTKGTSSTAVDWNDTVCGSATAIASAATLAPTLMPNVGDSVIIVKTSYDYTSPISYVLAASYTLTATAYARPRNVAKVTHE